MKFLKIIFLIIFFCINEAIAVKKILDKIIAVVDNSIILESDIHTILSTAKEKKLKIFNYNFIIRRQIIHKLIIDNLIIQLAERAKITVSDSNIDQAIGNIATHNYINIDKLRSRLTYKDIDYNFYCIKIRKEILLYEVINFFVRSSIIIFPQEIYFLSQKNIFNKNKFKNLYLNLSNLFIKLPTNYTKKNIEKVYYLIKLLRTKIIIYEYFNIKNISISNYTGIHVLKANHIGWIKKNNIPIFIYDNFNKESIIGPIFSKIGFYIIKINDIRNSNSNKLIIFDEVHAKHIMLRSVIMNDEKSCITLMDIAQQINSGHISFNDAAKQLSEEKYSSIHCGDLGWNENNFFDPALRDILIHLKKGEIGTPVQSSYGWHIIQLINKRKIDRTKSENKKNAYSILFNRKLAQETINFIKKQRTSIYVTIFTTINKVNKKYFL